jgi:hypothetical protein
MKNLLNISVSAIVILLATSAAFAQTTTGKPNQNTSTVAPKTIDKNSALNGVDEKYIVTTPNGDKLIMIAPPDEGKSAGDSLKHEEKQTPMKKEKEEPK